MTDNNKEFEEEKNDGFVDDVSFEELTADGEEMTEKQKDKSSKDKLKEKFEDRLERLEKERDEYLNLSLRTQADYKNREREIEEYKKTFTTFANQRLIRDMLPVLDGYDMARVNKEMWESVDSNWRMGVEYLFSQMLSVLSQNGLKTFGEVGDAYDTTLHEAIEMIDLEESEKEKDGKIVNVIQKGYKLGETILRPARVKVGEFKN